MLNEIQRAFAHPEARAAAPDEDTRYDRISLRDHVVKVEIGAFQAERGTTQRIRFNVVVEVAAPGDPVGDDVDRVLSYDTLTEAIATELADGRLNLLETLAENIATRVLLAPQARRIFLRIEKLDRGPGALGVEIVRARAGTVSAPAEPARDMAGTTCGSPAVGPLVAFLPDPLNLAPGFSGWIDRKLEGGQALILCVGHGDRPSPASALLSAQRRIELLAIEQSAWLLAGQEPRCVVRETRTELDWAIRNRQISVWAPTKIVLDTINGPDPAPRTPMALALWLAVRIGAGAFVTRGIDPPDDAPISARREDLAG